jgi:hypothetical protein
MAVLRYGSVELVTRVVKLNHTDGGNRESVTVMHADARSWIGFLVGAGLAGLAVAAGHIGALVYLMDVHPGVAGWVQAIGSVAAILATAGIFIAQEQSRKREADEKAAALARTVAEMALHATNVVTARLNSALGPKILYLLRGDQTTEKIQAMREIEVITLAPQVAMNFAYVRSGVFAINQRITAVYRQEAEERAELSERMKARPEYVDFNLRKERLMSSARMLKQTRTWLNALYHSIGMPNPPYATAHEVELLIRHASEERFSSEAAID